MEEPLVVKFKNSIPCWIWCPVVSQANDELFVEERRTMLSCTHAFSNVYITKSQPRQYPKDKVGMKCSQRRLWRLFLCPLPFSKMRITVFRGLLQVWFDSHAMPLACRS